MSGLTFPNHPRSGDWETLKGGTLGVHLQPVDEGHNSGDARFNGEVPGAGGWESMILPTVAPTRGGGTMAK